MGGGEVSELISNIFEGTGSWIYDLHVASDILLAPDFAEV
jgi:hypothetical protein